MRRGMWALIAIASLWGTSQEGLNAGGKHRLFGCAGCGAPVSTCASPWNCGSPLGCAAPYRGFSNCSQPGCFAPACGYPTCGFPTCGFASGCSVPSCGFASCFAPSCSGAACSQPWAVGCAAPSCGLPTGDVQFDSAFDTSLPLTQMVPDYYAPASPLPAAIPGIPAAEDVVW